MTVCRNIVLAALCALTLAGCQREAAEQREAELERLRQENAALQQQLEASKGGRSSAESRIGELTREVQNLTDRMASLVKDLDAGREIVAAAEARYQEAQRQLQDATNQVDALKSALTKTVQDATAATDRYEAEIQRLQQQVSELTTRLAELGRNPDRLRQLLPGQNQGEPAQPPAGSPR